MTTRTERGSAARASSEQLSHGEGLAEASHGVSGPTDRVTAQGQGAREHTQGSFGKSYKTVAIVASLAMEAISGESRHMAIPHLLEMHLQSTF